MRVHLHNTTSGRYRLGVRTCRAREGQSSTPWQPVATVVNGSMVGRAKFFGCQLLQSKAAGPSLDHAADV